MNKIKYLNELAFKVNSKIARVEEIKKDKYRYLLDKSQVINNSLEEDYNFYSYKEIIKIIKSF